MAEKTSFKTISENRQVRHEYFVEETYEAGIELYGTEVKSLRAGTVNMKDSWCSIEDGEIFIKQLHISPYEHGNIFNRDPLRVRRLLMHKSCDPSSVGSAQTGRLYSDSALPVFQGIAGQGKGGPV